MIASIALLGGCTIAAAIGAAVVLADVTGPAPVRIITTLDVTTWREEQKAELRAMARRRTARDTWIAREDTVLMATYTPTVLAEQSTVDVSEPEPDDESATLVGRVDHTGQLRIVEVRSARRDLALIRRVHAGLFVPAVVIDRPLARVVRLYATDEHRLLAVAA